MDPSVKPHADNRVEQQKLPHAYTRHTPIPVTITLLIVALSFIPVGVVVIVASDRITEVDVRYDHVNKYKYAMGPAGTYEEEFDFNGSTYSTGEVVSVSFELKKSLSAPVFLQYRLKRFYQNYRWFGASVDWGQLKGSGSSVGDDCNPYRYPGEVRGSKRQPGYYSPCGALAWSLFNDTISLYTKSGELICDGRAFATNSTNLNPGNKCRKKGIALNHDVKSSYHPPKEMKDESGPMWTSEGDPSSSDPFLQKGYYYKEPGHKIPSSIDEDFIVWTKTGYLADFSNVYRVVEKDLVAGEYYLNITEFFDVSSFSGEKHVEVVTRGWIGGKNHALGILLIIVGCVAMILAIAVVILRLAVRG